MARQLFDFGLRVDGDLTSGRMEIWASAISTVKDNPLFGIGLGNQSAYIVGNLPTAHAKYMFEDISGSHNLYISKSLELGLAAVPLFLYLFYSLIKIAVRNFTLDLPKIFRIINIAGFGVIIAVFVRSFIEGSVLIQAGGIFPIFYAWIIIFWPLQISQKFAKSKNP
jgi:O-antigen ligase